MGNHDTYAGNEGRRRSRIGGRIAAWAFPFLAAICVASGANAQPVPIGTAVGVEPAATAELGGTQVTLISGADLYEGQTIVTDANGEVQIVFVDDTRMVLGPNSALVIERYLLRSPDTVEDLTVNILGGAFRFISGNSPSDSYTVSTPTGDIVVRGTWFDGFVDWLTGIAEVMVYQGSVYMCPTEETGQFCIFLDVTCSIGILDTNDAEVIREEGVRMSLANDHFPFAQFEQGLLPGFRFGTAPDCLEDLTAEDVEAEVKIILDEGPVDPPCVSESCEPPCVSDSCEEPPDPDYPCDNAPISCEDSSDVCSESGCCSESSPCCSDSSPCCSDSSPCCSDSSPCCASSPSSSCVISLRPPAGTLPALYANDDLVGRRAA